MTRRHWLIGAVLLAVTAVLPACGGGTPVEGREITVACGLCRFQMEGASRCFWAAEVDGKQIPLTGPAIPTDHDAHGPEGMCVVKRTARVTGTLHDDKLVADGFELLPYDGPASAAEPHDHEH